MKILFVYPCLKLEKTAHHGIASLSACLKEVGHETGLIYLESKDFNKAFERIRGFGPDLIAISVVTNQWNFVKDFISAFKRSFKIPIVCGGAHINADTEAIKEIPEVDALCYGEGEYPLKEFAERLKKNASFKDIKNLYYLDNSKIKKNDSYPLIAELDSLPLPDYEIFTKEVYLNYPSLSFSRGCPHNCTYCCNELLRNMYRQKGNYIRFKSAGRAMKEIENVITKFNPSILNFDDDSFTKSRKWVLDFCAEYPKRFKLPFRCNARPEQLDEELISSLKKANCELISIGIESGNEDLRKRVLKRNMSNADIEKAFELCKKYNIKTSSFNMVGIPEETPELFRDTLELNKKVMPDLVQLTIFYPYPGTELGEYCKQKGYIVDKQHAESYFRKGVLELPDFSYKEIRKAYKDFYWEMYKDRNISRYFLKVYLEEYPFLWEKAKLLKRLLKKLY
ncbi:MAG: B12-binding domain-containing radical SAM protein [Elusimicrobia bacterium]|nr:B12-binding domain-containing radical SAM protein [Candidatus Liberimonas magnetica]